MNIWLLAVGLVPIVIFVVGSSLGGDRAGIWSALVSGIVALAMIVGLTGEVDEAIFLEAGLIITLSVIALKLDNPFYFKIQPAINRGVLGLFLLYFELFSESYMIIMMRRLAVIEPKSAQLLALPGGVEMIQSYSLQLIALLLVNGGLIYLVAKKKNWIWLVTQLSIYPLSLGLAVVNSLIYLKPPS